VIRRSLKSSLLLSVAGLVVGTSLLVTVLAAQRYGASLEEALRAQAEYQAQSLALQAEDLVLINDLAALQRLLDQEVSTHPGLGYAFVARDGQILAHTFPRGMPQGLVEANAPGPDGSTGVRRVAAKDGRRFLDLAQPVFASRAGILRLGFLVDVPGQRVRRLWSEVGLLALVILVPALAGGLLFMRRITTPLGELARATREMAEGRLEARVPEQGQDELAALAEAFNHMAGRLEASTRRMEAQAADLERTHRQLSTAYEIIRRVSGQASLQDVAATLMEAFGELIRCRHMVLLIFESDHSTLFSLTSEGTFTLRDPALLAQAETSLAGLRAFAVSRGKLFSAPLVPASFASFASQAVIPLSCEGKGLCGALVIACPGDCACDFHETDMVGLVLAHTAGSIVRAARHEEELRQLRAGLDTRPEFAGMVGKDPTMQNLFRLIENVAPSDATVLVQGESGTGKELVARAIHGLSPRADKPLVVINCSAYPASLLESELFGHEKGAFTGAVKQRPGRFELADGGTVFLDEIGEIPPQAQVKLLRVLQTRKFERVGGDRTLSVDVRVVAATNKDLLEEVRAGNFREDLYYRLDVVPIHLPPLRERGNDAALLARHFLRRFAAQQAKDVAEIDSRAMRLLLDYPWPGNVRELENVMEQAVVLAKGRTIDLSDLPPRLQSARPTPQRTILEQERQLLVAALEECGWNKSLAAQRLGIGRSTLYAKLRRHHIAEPQS